MTPWNHHSNVGDVLALGPRTAGKLAVVGIRTVAELLAAKPHVTTARLQDSAINADVIVQWQHESQLRISLPKLPSEACRFLAAAGFSYAETICQTAPTELLTALEVVKQNNTVDWLAKRPLPTISEVSQWIRTAQLSKKSRAA